MIWKTIQNIWTSTRAQKTKTLIHALNRLDLKMPWLNSWWFAKNHKTRLWQTMKSKLKTQYNQSLVGRIYLAARNKRKWTRKPFRSDMILHKKMCPLNLKAMRTRKNTQIIWISKSENEWHVTKIHLASLIFLFHTIFSHGAWRLVEFDRQIRSNSLKIKINHAMITTYQQHTNAPQPTWHEPTTTQTSGLSGRTATHHESQAGGTRGMWQVWVSFDGAWVVFTCSWVRYWGVNGRELD